MSISQAQKVLGHPYLSSRFYAKTGIDWNFPLSEAFLIPPDDPETDERCRAIERGARLITAMPTSFSLILQMPRGNLETIFPRALVLAGIRRSIASKDYKAAFLACRNHRVDMNILHDHAPVQFMLNVGLFIDQIRKVEHLDLFLSQLKCTSLTLLFRRC